MSALEGHKVVAAVAGWEFSVTLTEDGKVFSFGAGEAAQLGHGLGPQSPAQSLEGFLGFNLTIPARVSALEGSHVAEIATGSTHCVARMSDGGLCTFGAGKCGELGYLDPGALRLPKRLEQSPLI